MIFDSTSIGSDNILDIFKKLESEKCLKKEKNLYILNRIDQCTKGGQGDIIDAFKNYFYKVFEDEKNKERIVINFSENYFLPMNSLLYEAETKIKEDFYSLLLFELFTYSEFDNKSEFNNFFEFIQKRIDAIIMHNNVDIESIEEKMKKIKDDGNEMKIISKSIEKIKKHVQTIKANSEIQLGIKLEKNNIKKELKKLFLIQKENYYNCIHSESYNVLQDIVSKITLNENDLSTPPSIFLEQNENCLDNNINKINIDDNIKVNENKIIEKSNNINQKKNINNFNDINPSLIIIKELDNFINETFKLIDPTNELEDFKLSLNTLRENVLGRKIRISLIGNISVGKSTVLNCIIGEELLPTKETECTYRGVIIRNKNINNFELYRTKLVSKGEGFDKYYYFLDEDKPYTRGISNIKSYLNNKNNDKKISDDDAYIVIVGRLKIFDFIQLDQNLIDKIEFVDLPGPDRRDNTFNEQKYYEKILRFSNCCVYINEPKSINDQNSVDRMRDQYRSDKNKIIINLRNNYIKTCLFLINKSDSLEGDDDKEKIVNVLLKTIPEKDISINNIHVSFFSGKLFNEYLEYYDKYVYMIDKNPFYTLNFLYNEWSSNLIYLRTFKYYIINKISGKIEEKFDLDLDEEVETPESFYDKLRDAFNRLYKSNYKGISNKDEDKIIDKLYLIYLNLKNKNLYKTNYSPAFFDELKNVISFSEELQKKNLKGSLETFFSHADQLFSKEIEKENENERKENKEKFDFIKNTIIPRTNELFKEKAKKIKEITELTIYRCNNIFEDEIKNIEERLKAVDKDVEKAAKLLESKIQGELEKMSQDQKKESESLLREIELLLKESINKFYEHKNLTKSQIDTNKGITFKMLISLFTSTLSGIAVRTGLVLVAESLLAGAAAAGASAGGVALSSTAAGALLGPVGIAIGFGVGIAISLTTFLVHWFSKNKRYKNGIEGCRTQLKKKLDEFIDNFDTDFNIYRDTIIKDLNIRIGILKKQINSVDKKKWKEIKDN